MLCTLKIRTRCGAVFAAGVSHSAHSAIAVRGGVLLGVLTGFTVAFAAIAAITVTRTAFTTLTCRVLGVALVCGHGFLAVCDDGRGLAVQLCRGFVFLAALSTLAAFTAALTFAAFTPFTAALAFAALTTLGARCAFCALCAHFAAVSVQLCWGFAALATGFAAAVFPGCAFTCSALATFSTLAACGSGFAIAQFVAAFTAFTYFCAAFDATLCTAFRATRTFTGCTAFGRCAVAAFATATTTAAIAATITVAFAAFAVTA